MNVTELSHPNDRDYDRKSLVNYLSGETPTFDIQKFYAHKDGELIWVYITAALVYDTEGRPLRLIGVLQFVIERKMAEQERERLLYVIQPER